MKYFIPENLNIDFLLEQTPPVRIKRFKKEHLLYILDLITNIPATTKSILLSDYVPINSVLLQKKVRNYRVYLDYLIENKVLITDNQYKRGRKSIGYRFA